MFRYFAMLLCLLPWSATVAQTINLHGTVLNRAGKPVANAVLTLKGLGMRDTTGSDGTYVLSQTTATAAPMLIPQNRTMFIERGFLVLSLPASSPVTVELFNVKGTLLNKASMANALSGFYRFPITNNTRAAEVIIIRATIGNDKATFRYLPMNNDRYGVNFSESNSVTENGRLAKITAISDTINVTAPNYKATAIAITSYEQKLDITLDTAGGGEAGAHRRLRKNPYA